MVVFWYFYLLVTALVGFKIFLTKNPIYSMFLFILTVLNMSFFLLYLNVDFFAFVIIMMYVGAIMILFMFSVMLLNIKSYQRNIYFFKYLPASSVIFIALFVAFGMTTVEQHNYTSPYLSEYVNGFGYMDWMGQLYYIDVLSVVGYLLFTHYWFVTILLSFLLLIAILGSIMLTFNNAGNFKKQEAFSQVEASYKRILKFKRSKK